jgi:hypothetical protein
MKLFIAGITLALSLTAQAAVISVQVNNWKESSKGISVDDVVHTNSGIQFSWSIRTGNTGYVYADNYGDVVNTLMTIANVSSVCDLSNAADLRFNRVTSEFSGNEIFVFKNHNSREFVVFQPSKISGTGANAMLSGTWYVETEGTGDFSNAHGCVQHPEL